MSIVGLDFCPPSDAAERVPHFFCLCAYFICRNVFLLPCDVFLTIILLHATFSFAHIHVYSRPRLLSTIRCCREGATFFVFVHISPVVMYFYCHVMFFLTIIHLHATFTSAHIHDYSRPWLFVTHQMLQRGCHFTIAPAPPSTISYPIPFFILLLWWKHQGGCRNSAPLVCRRHGNTSVGGGWTLFARWLTHEISVD